MTGQQEAALSPAQPSSAEVDQNAAGFYTYAFHVVKVFELVQVAMQHRRRWHPTAGSLLVVRSCEAFNETPFSAGHAIVR